MNRSGDNIDDVDREAMHKIRMRTTQFHDRARTALKRISIITYRCGGIACCSPACSIPP